MSELNEMQISTLAEIGTVSMGSSATAMSKLLDKQTVISTPQVKLNTLENLKKKHVVPCVVVIVEYSGDVSCKNMFIIKEQDVAIIASLMIGVDPTSKVNELDEMQVSAIGEATNQMMGASATSLAEMLGLNVRASTPQVNYLKNLGDVEVEDEEITDEELVEINFKFEIGSLVDSELVLLMPKKFASTISSTLLDKIGDPQVQTESQPDNELLKNSEAEEVETSEIENIMNYTSEPEEEESDKQPSKQQSIKTAPVQKAAGNNKVNNENISIIRDVPVEITAVFGKATMKMDDILQLNHGNVVELDRMQNEPVDILANNRIVAKGIVVVVEGEYGVKITEVIKESS